MLTELGIAFIFVAMKGISSVSGQLNYAAGVQAAVSTATLKNSLNSQKEAGQALVQMLNQSAPLAQGVGTKVDMYA